MTELPGSCMIQVAWDGVGECRQLSSLNASIKGMRLSARSDRALRDAGIVLVRDLLKKTSEELLEIRGFGETCLTEVRERLAELGLRLRDD